MPNRIRERICRICQKHARPLQIVEGWFLLLLVVGGSGAIGHLAGLVRADVQIAQQAREHQAEQQRLTDINRQLLLIIEHRLPPLVGQVDTAVQAAQEAVLKAEGAAKAASGAGATARSASASASKAASAAKSAATKASEAAADVKEAVTPQPAEPKDPPDWLGGS